MKFKQKILEMYLNQALLWIMIDFDMFDGFWHALFCAC